MFGIIPIYILDSLSLSLSLSLFLSVLCLSNEPPPPTSPRTTEELPEELPLSMGEPDTTHVFKGVVLGSKGCGKSTLLQRMCDMYGGTTVEDDGSHLITIHLSTTVVGGVHDDDGSAISTQLQIWDCALDVEIPSLPPLPTHTADVYIYIHIRLFCVVLSYWQS